MGIAAFDLKVTMGGAKAKAKKTFKTKPVGATTSCCPPPLPKILIHLDADRDGKVDEDVTGLDRWVPGKGKKGAVILVNCDADGAKDVIDNENEKVDGAKDVSDLAPLVFRRTPLDRTFPPGYKAYLSCVSDKIRIFDKRSPAGAQVIGPKTDASYKLPDISFKELTYGMEATDYPRDNADPDLAFDGQIELILEIVDPGDEVVQIQTAKVRVAPWLMPNHLNKTLEVFVTNTGDNSLFLSQVEAGVGKAGAPLTKWSDTDRWMQDVMELGFSTMPRVETPKPAPEWHLPVVMRTVNTRPGYGNLVKYPREKLLGPDFGYFQSETPFQNGSMDSFGNLECSPPVTVAGKEYKLGRIIHGDVARKADGSSANPYHRPMAQSVRDFLKGQKVQQPFTIDTGWLVVGHVDEVLSFCPCPSYVKKFKVVMGSPKLALDILRHLKATGQGAAPMFKDVWTSPVGGLDVDHAPTTPNAVLANAAVVAVQNLVQGKIDEIERIVRTNLGLGNDPAAVLKIPVLFRDVGHEEYIAYTAGAANMLVVTKGDKTAVLCIPKPFGPAVGGKCQFEAKVEEVLGPTGNPIQFVDDFVTYHQMMGEVHCGTNSKREPPIDVFWWEQEGI